MTYEEEKALAAQIPWESELCAMEARATLDTWGDVAKLTAAIRITRKLLEEHVCDCCNDPSPPLCKACHYYPLVYGEPY